MNRNSSLLRALLFTLLVSLLIPTASWAKGKDVIMETSLGKFRIALDDEKAPATVANFRTYVKEGFYDGLIFHRVIPGFVIQGGGFAPGMKQKTTRAPIKNEAANGLKNLRGTLSMARTQDPNSATSQFFVNVNDNASLDYRGMDRASIGYAVFGKVTEGMEVVDKIVSTPTTSVGFHQDVPAKDVIILKAYEAE